MLPIYRNGLLNLRIRTPNQALQAAGKIHSDMERGFIRAEVYVFDTNNLG